MNIATDIEKLRTSEGKTICGIKNKTLLEITGFQTDSKDKKIEYVAAIVNVHPVVSEHYYDGNSRAIEDRVEGICVQAKRWAVVDDVWEDRIYAMKLWKYFKAYQVPADLWLPGYEKQWKNSSEGMPHENVTWSASEEL